MIDLPGDKEGLLQRQVETAGFADVWSLIEQDRLDREYLASLASNERLEKLAPHGIESGDAGEMTLRNWKRVRQEVMDRMENRHRPH